MTWIAAHQLSLIAPPHPKIVIHYPDHHTKAANDIGTAVIHAKRLLATTGKAHISDTAGWAINITKTGSTIHQPTNNNTTQPQWLNVIAKRLKDTP